jgi:hypothetical protein
MKQFYGLQEDFKPNDRRYSGCGNGWVRIHKEKDKVVEMSYASDGVSIDREQNISMCSSAGKVLSEDGTYITVRANFSAYQACLF